MNIDKVLSDNRKSEALFGLTKSVFDQLIPEFKKGLKKYTPRNTYRGGRPG